MSVIAVKSINTISGLVNSTIDSVLYIVGVDSYRLRTRAHALYSLATIDQKSVEAFMESYKLFDGDWTNDNGKNEDHIIDYYRVINHLCALGNVEKMYIPPLRDPNLGVCANQELYERKMMEDILVPPDGKQTDKKVLDIGCGRGRVAMHTARATGARVWGINIDPSQIQNAKEYSERIGLKDRTDFKVASINDPLPYPDEHFDAAYNIQAFTYSKDKVALFKEIFRILKPGSKFSYLDWVLLDNYDPENPEHVEHVKKTMPFIGAVDTVHYSEIEKAMTAAGFVVTLSADASIGGHQGPLINAERKTFGWLRTFARVFLPSRFIVMLRRLREYAEAFVAADELRIATTSYQIVCQKPAKK